VHRAFLAVSQAAYGDYQDYAWAEPHTYARLGRLISQNTGIDLVLPALPS
jgi:hypothetical protein